MGKLADQVMEEPEQSLASSKAARGFCQRHGILDEVRTAIALARDAFPFRRKLEVRVENDPEEEGEWLVVEVEASEDVAKLLDAYNRCVGLWAEHLPPAALSRIRLAYSLS